MPCHRRRATSFARALRVAVAALPLAAFACERSAGVSDAAADRAWRERLARGASPAVVQILVSSPQGMRRGAGFILDPGGLIVTTLPLLRDATAVLVQRPPEESYYRASVLARDERHGTAVLDIEAADLPALELGSSDVVPTGSRAAAVGPAGKVSSGVLGSLQFDGSYALRLATPIGPGLAGGPVFGEDGGVIGMAVLRTADGREETVVLPSIYMREVVARAGNQLVEQLAAAAEPPPDPGGELGEAGARPPDRKSVV